MQRRGYGGHTRGSGPVPLVRKVFGGRLSAKGVIELEESIQSANPRIIVLGAYHARHSAMPFLAGARSPYKLALDVDLRSGQDAGAPSAVDAQVQLAASVLGAHPQRDFGVQREHQRSEAEAAGADGRDEQRLYQRMHNRTSGAQAVSR